MSGSKAQSAIFCDFNGTVIDRDMLAVLLESFGKANLLRELRDARSRGFLTQRECIAAQARALTCSLDEADARLRSLVTFDETFEPFYRRNVASRVPLVIVSSGLEPLIARMLERHHIAAPILANGVEASPKGWTVAFRDATPEGNAKRPYVEAALRDGYKTVTIGDDESDFGMAAVADVRFARRGSPLHAFLVERNLDHYPFDAFEDVSRRCAEERLLA